MEELRNILEKNAFSFKKKFGQNFLTDPNLLSAIVRDADAEGRNVLEIGTGAGTLTRALSAVADRVLSFEVDRSLQPVLSETLAGCENVEVLFADFLKSDLAGTEKELGEYVVVANLPYYITTPVVMRFAEESRLCRSVTVMVQEEVARRFCAAENAPEYGAVTAAIARRGKCAVTRTVSRNLFTPRPNVDSAVVRMDFTQGGFEVGSRNAFRKTVACAFQNRRKTLENNLMHAFSLSRAEAAELLAAAGVERSARGESLSPRMLGRLSDLLYERGIAE